MSEQSVLKPDDELDHGLEMALKWANLHQDYSRYEVVTSRAWATTVRLIKGRESTYLKLIPDLNPKRSAFYSCLAHYAGQSIPLLLASDVEHGWFLFKDHGGTDLGRKQNHENKIEIIKAYGKLQVAISQDSVGQELETVPNASIYWDHLCEFLNAENDTPKLDGRVGGAYFLGLEKSAYYLAELQKNKAALMPYLLRSSHLPKVVEHTDLRPSNMARNADGSLIFYDWDDAVVAPLGFSLHNQFSGCSRPLLALMKAPNAKDVSEDQRKQDRALLTAYINAIEPLDISKIQQNAAALSASITLGVVHHILDFAAFPPTSKGARSTIGKVIAKRLDDLLVVAHHLTSNPKDRKTPRSKKWSLEDNIKRSDEKGIVPTISITKEEQAAGELSSEHISIGAALFKRHGTLLIEDAFPVSLIDEAREQFFDGYQRYFSNQKHDDALRVGDKRFMITLAMETPFNKPAFFGSPMVLPLMDQLLTNECILSSMTCVTSLPGSQDQRLHKDHPALFPDHPDLILPPLAVTVIVPLVDLDKVTGATRLLKGSHKMTSREAKKMEYQDPIVKKGSCYLMDFRLSHQGLANNSNAPRPIVSLVYQRRWFRDYMNFEEQQALVLNKTDLKKMPRRHRKLVDWAKGS